jgi:hypothetical protein
VAQPRRLYLSPLAGGAVLVFADISGAICRARGSRSGLPRKAAGSGPPVAQSISETVCSTGTCV